MKTLKPTELKPYGMSKSTAAKLRMTGGGPLYAKFGRSVVYLESDVVDWLKAQRVTSGAEAAERDRRQAEAA